MSDCLPCRLISRQVAVNAAVPTSPLADLDPQDGVWLMAHLKKEGSAPRMTTDICEVIVTADNAEWLAGLTRELVEARLIACGQNIGQIRSIYRWQGVIEDEAEARVAFHTRADLVPEVIERAKEKHSYDVPCIIVLPIIDGNPDYIDWVRLETKG